MAGSSIVRTRPRNHAWDHCGETSAYKTTQRPLLYPCLNEWDVLMWSIRLCNSLGEASPYKVTWLHRLYICCTVNDFCRRYKRASFSSYTGCNYCITLLFVVLIWWICPFPCLVSVKGQHLHESLCFFFVYSSVIIPLTQLLEQIVGTRSQLQPCALHIYIPNIGYLPDIRCKSHVVSKISNFIAPWPSPNSIYIYISPLLYVNAI